MIDRRTVFEIHRLKDEGLSQRQISKKLCLSRQTVKNYLDNPEQRIMNNSKRHSLITPYLELMDDFLKEEPNVKAPVVLQRLQEKGFRGKITIVRDCLKSKRSRLKIQKPFIRFESPPGKQIQIDWGHFGTLQYGNTKRKLYALAMTECYSRLLFVKFMHSQSQSSLHQALLNGFEFFGGTSEELVVDNMLTAVSERVGRIIRFNEKFLDFLRYFHITPYACNVNAPHEKGKIENVIGYIRTNFWPLRKYIDINDVQRQCDHWLKIVANVRIHQTTGEQPIIRAEKVHLRPLPDNLPDLREPTHYKVHKDYAIKFDGNTYTVPPSMIDKSITIKGDTQNIYIYYKDQKIVTHDRCWEKNKRIENASHTQQVKKIQRKLWQDRQIKLFTCLGDEAVEYLNGLAKAGQPIKKSASKLLSLKDEYGTTSLIYAINKAISYKAYGVEYIENILHQEMTPKKNYQPVQFKNEALNRIRLEEPKLEDYDAYVLKGRIK